MEVVVEAAQGMARWHTRHDVSVYVEIAQAFVALKNGTGPHTTGERRFKCGHNKEHALYPLDSREPTLEPTMWGFV